MICSRNSSLSSRCSNTAAILLPSVFSFSGLLALLRRSLILKGSIRNIFTSLSKLNELFWYNMLVSNEFLLSLKNLRIIPVIAPLTISLLISSLFFNAPKTVPPVIPNKIEDRYSTNLFSFPSFFFNSNFRASSLLSKIVFPFLKIFKYSCFTDTGTVGNEGSNDDLLRRISISYSYTCSSISAFIR